MSELVCEVPSSQLVIDTCSCIYRVIACSLSCTYIHADMQARACSAHGRAPLSVRCNTCNDSAGEIHFISQLKFITGGDGWLMSSCTVHPLT